MMSVVGVLSPKCLMWLRSYVPNSILGLLIKLLTWKSEYFCYIWFSFIQGKIKKYYKNTQLRFYTKYVTVGLNRIWENEKMNQANGYHSSPDPYVGNQKAPKIEKFHELIWRTLRFFLALSINYSFWGTWHTFLHKTSIL